MLLLLCAMLYQIITIVYYDREHRTSSANSTLFSRSQFVTLKSQFVISSLEDADNEMVSVEYGGSRYLSFAFADSWI